MRGLLPAICGSFNALCELQIGYVAGLDEGEIESILLAVPTLQHLVLTNTRPEWHEGDFGYWSLSSALRTGLCRLPNLSHLYLEGLSADSSMLEAAFAPLCLPHLRQLAIVLCEFDDTFTSWFCGAGSTRYALSIMQLRCPLADAASAYKACLCCTKPASLPKPHGHSSVKAFPSGVPELHPRCS